MGTSKSLPTPSGGPWTPLKNDITDRLGGDRTVNPGKIVGGAIRAAGLAAPSPSSGRRGGGGGGGGAGGGGRGVGGGGGGGGQSGRSSIGRAASGLAGFGAAVRDGGLDAGLEALGLADLRDRPAAEIVAAIAEHLAQGVEGLQGELLRVALRDAVFEAATIGGDPELKDMGRALQTYIGQSGPEGLAELTLSNFVFDRVWSVIESHVNEKAAGNASAQALELAVQGACRSHVQSHMDEARAAGTFDRLDWFGRDGIRVGTQIATELETKLKAL